MNADQVRYKPLYLQVKEVILKRIANEVYRKGEFIPSEASLAEEFGTSISTIRQALSILVADAVLIKKQGRGTYVSAQKTMLRFFSWIGDTEIGKKILEDTVELFQKKHPSLVIEYIPTTYHVAKDELLRLITTGNAPDIVQIMAHWTSYFASMGALAQLDRLLDKDNLSNRSFEKDLYGGMYQGKLYSVAWGLSPVSLLANKNVLREAGLELPESPMTLDTFFKICQQLDHFYKTQEKYSYALSISSDKETDFLTIYFFLQAFKGGFLNEEGEIIFNSKANIAAFKWLRNFTAHCRVLKSDIFTIRKRFALNDIAFISDGPWAKYLLEQSTGRDFDEDFAVMLNPVHADSHSYSWNYNHALAICSQSHHKLHAAQFIDALTADYEIFSRYCSKAGILPVHEKHLDNSICDSQFFKGFKQQLLHASCIDAQNAMFTKAIFFCLDAVKKILYEDVDIEQELQEKEYYLNMLYNE